jgi:hypothetical protein
MFNFEKNLKKKKLEEILNDTDLGYKYFLIDRFFDFKRLD